MKNNAVTDQEKREKKIVVKKLAEMEEELKVRVCINVTKFGTQYYWNYFQLLALSENLTDQVRSLLSFDDFYPNHKNRFICIHFHFSDIGPTEVRQLPAEGREHRAVTGHSQDVQVIQTECQGPEGGLAAQQKLRSAPPQDILPRAD